MVKRIIGLAALLCIVLSALAHAEDVVLLASEAVFDAVEGVSPHNVLAPMAYDAEHDLIVNIADGSDIVFTVPEGTAGTFDLYLTVTRAMAPYSSQPFIFRLNDGRAFSVPADYPGTAEGNADMLLDKGQVLICSGLALSAGDRITVTAAFGARVNGLIAAGYPAVGNLLLSPVRNDSRLDSNLSTPPHLQILASHPDDPLSGLNILWLGSSVTYGAKSVGLYSMVDVIADQHPGTTCEKYTVCSTTLVNISADSYVERLKLIPTDRHADLLVVQMSTKDALWEEPLGCVSDSFDVADFDDTTVAGAIETIIAYAQKTFDCPIAFYTGTWYDSKVYAQMADLLPEIQKKWGICVIDLFHREEMTAIIGTELYDAYMADATHPSRRGYVEWWAPVFEEELSEYLSRHNP